LSVIEFLTLSGLVISVNDVNNCISAYLFIFVASSYNLTRTGFRIDLSVLISAKRIEVEVMYFEYLDVHFSDTEMCGLWITFQS
jgi:hypothetical protein